MGGAAPRDHPHELLLNVLAQAERLAAIGVKQRCSTRASAEQLGLHAGVVQGWDGDGLGSAWADLARGQTRLRLECDHD